MSPKELKKHLPPYIFMSNKRKKKYFKTLSKTYVEKVAPRRIEKEGEKKVSFLLDENHVVSFFKAEKICK